MDRLRVGRRQCRGPVRILAARCGVGAGGARRRRRPRRVCGPTTRLSSLRETPAVAGKAAIREFVVKSFSHSRLQYFLEDGQRRGVPKRRPCLRDRAGLIPGSRCKARDGGGAGSILAQRRGHGDASSTSGTTRPRRFRERSLRLTPTTIERVQLACRGSRHRSRMIRRPELTRLLQRGSSRELIRNHDEGLGRRTVPGGSRPLPSSSWSRLCSSSRSAWAPGSFSAPPPSRAGRRPSPGG